LRFERRSPFYSPQINVYAIDFVVVALDQRQIPEPSVPDIFGQQNSGRE
jgi:hypothetical protein